MNGKQSETQAKSQTGCISFGTLLKMEFFSQSRSKAFYIIMGLYFLHAIYSMNFAVTYNIGDVTLDHLIGTSFNLVDLCLVAIYCTSYASKMWETLYFKNLQAAEIVRWKVMLVKYVVVFLYITVLRIILVGVIFVSSLVIPNYAPGNVSGGVGIFFLSFLLEYAFACFCVCICNVLRNGTICLVIGVYFSTGIYILSYFVGGFTREFVNKLTLKNLLISYHYHYLRGGEGSTAQIIWAIMVALFTMVIAIAVDYYQINKRDMI